MQQPVTGDKTEWITRSRLASFWESFRGASYFKILLLIIKVSLGLLLLVFSIQGINWDNLISGIRSAKLAWLALGILAVLIGLLIKIWRWAILLKNYQIRSSIPRLTSAYFIGQATNILAPIRVGEIIRAGYFTEDPKTLPEVASTIFIEKYLDIIGLVLCALYVSAKTSIDHVMSLQSWLLPVAGALTLLALLGIFLGPIAWGKAREATRVPEGVRKIIDQWVQASLWLRKPRQVLPAILLTAMIWGLGWSTSLLLFKSLGMPVNIDAAGLVLITGYVTKLPALMPGNIGPAYFFTRLALMPFGIMQDRAFVFAVILHALITLPPLLGGLAGVLIRRTRVVRQ